MDTLSTHHINLRAYRKGGVAIVNGHPVFVPPFVPGSGGWRAAFRSAIRNACKGRLDPVLAVPLPDKRLSQAELWRLEAAKRLNQPSPGDGTPPLPPDELPDLADFRNVLALVAMAHGSQKKLETLLVEKFKQPLPIARKLAKKVTARASSYLQGKLSQTLGRVRAMRIDDAILLEPSWP